MVIKCKGSNRFHLKINIEEYYENIKKMGLDITFPLILEIPCRKCGMMEVYEVFPTHYEHVKSYKEKR